MPRAKKQKMKSDRSNDMKLKEIEDICREAMYFKCGCGKYCLATVAEKTSDSLRMLVDYMTPWIAMGRTEHREKFFPILEGCARGVTNGGHLDKRLYNY
jgi:hypothetical protein